MASTVCASTVSRLSKRVMYTVRTIALVVMLASAAVPSGAQLAEVPTKQRQTLDRLENELAERIDRFGGAQASVAKVASQSSPHLSKLDFDELVEEVVARQKAIYGDDDRREAYEVADMAVLRNVRAAGALILSSQLRKAGESLRIHAERRGESERLCRSERFAGQPSPAFCSGFLVAPDIVASAGHCFEEIDVVDTRFVFSFELKAAGEMSTSFLPDEVYLGKKLLARRFENKGEDWALVQLDRPVADREPVVLSREPIPVGTPLYLVGHPSGLPKKFAAGGHVAKADDPRFFTTNVDAFGGNSGSMVVNEITNEVEGILVRGSEDYVRSPKCTRSVRCPITPLGKRLGPCGGEEVTRIERLADSLALPR